MLKSNKNNDKYNDKVKKDPDEVRAQRIKNLNPIKPGETRNPNGRPKGKRNFDTMVDLAIERLAIEMVKQHNAKKENKNKQMKLEDVDIEGDIFMQFIGKARAGDQKAIDSFLDRRMGKAKQPIELSGVDGNPIEYEIGIAEAKDRIKKFQSKWFKTPQK